MTTLKSVLLTTVCNSRKALRHHEILEKLNTKLSVNERVLSTMLWQLTSSGDLIKIPLFGETSKFAYAKGFSTRSISKIPATKLIKTVLTSDKMDSYEIWAKITHLDSSITKAKVDNTLWHLSNTGQINKSKNPMTDSNVASTQSKYLYSI